MREAIKVYCIFWILFFGMFAYRAADTFELRRRVISAMFYILRPFCPPEAVQ